MRNSKREMFIVISFEKKIGCCSATINVNIKGYEAFVLKGGPEEDETT